MDIIFASKECTEAGCYIILGQRSKDSLDLDCFYNILFCGFMYFVDFVFSLSLSLQAL